MNEEDRAKLDEVYEFMQQMKRADSITQDVDQAIRGRFEPTTLEPAEDKGADSEDQAVSEGGTGSYDVLGDPDGFLRVLNADGEVIGYVPKYNK